MPDVVPTNYSTAAAAESAASLVNDLFPSETVVPNDPTPLTMAKPDVTPQSFDDVDAEVLENEADEAGTEPAPVDPPSEEPAPVEAPEDGEMFDPEFDEIPKALADLKLTAPDPKRPNVKFTVKDNEGAVEAPIDLMVSFQADGGKIFKDVPLAQLVGLAQRGVYNARIAEEARELKAWVPQAQEAIESYQEALTALRAEYDTLMTSDEALDAAREQYHAAMSPEGRARSLEEQLRRERAERQLAEESRVVSSTVQSHVAPRVDALAAANTAVSLSEIGAYYDRLLAPLRKDGRIPPQRLAEAVRLIDTELTPWVEETNRVRLGQDRARSRTTTTAAAKAAATQQHVRSIARRRVGTVTPVPAKAPAAAAAANGKPPLVTRDGVMDGIRADIAREFGA